MDNISYFTVQLQNPQGTFFDTKEQFVDMARSGNAISDSRDGTFNLVERAHQLAFLMDGDATMGVMGLKRPRESYVESVERRADLPRGYLNNLAELGWCCIKPEARGKNGLYAMGKALMQYAEGQHLPVYTIVETSAEARHKLLEEAGFSQAGLEYVSEFSGKQYGVWVKKDEQSNTTADADYL